jgi:hypothetical protein
MDKAQAARDELEAAVDQDRPGLFNVTHQR